MTDDAAGAFDATHEMDRDRVPTGELPALPGGPVRSKPRTRPVRFTLKMILLVVVAIFLLPPVIAGFRQAADSVLDVNPFLLLAGFGLEIVALGCYSLLTRAALGTAGEGLSGMRIFRIQLSTKALSHIVPGGNAAGSALGYRLLTLSGISGPDAGFALATAGIGSAVVLNLIFWIGLIISIPIRGVNPGYGVAALLGVIIIGIAASLVFGLMEGQGRAERMVRWIARKLHLDQDKFAGALRQVGLRMDELLNDRQLLKRVVVWAAANWLIDAAALWVFLRAFGGSLSIDGLIVAFGLANILAAIPILPGGLGVVDGTYNGALVGFGLPRRIVAPGVAAYRSAQYLFPIFLGGLAYASLRVGPWSIEKRDRLSRLRDIARTEAAKGETSLDFALRFADHHPRPAEDGAEPAEPPSEAPADEAG